MNRLYVAEPAMSRHRRRTPTTASACAAPRWLAFARAVAAAARAWLPGRRRRSRPELARAGQGGGRRPRRPPRPRRSCWPAGASRRRSTRWPHAMNEALGNVGVTVTYARAGPGRRGAVVGRAPGAGPRDRGRPGRHPGGHRLEPGLRRPGRPRPGRAPRQGPERPLPLAPRGRDLAPLQLEARRGHPLRELGRRAVPRRRRLARPAAHRAALRERHRARPAGRLRRRRATGAPCAT